MMSQVRVTQGYSFSVNLYEITLVPLAEEIQAADPGLLSTFYTDDAAFYGSARRISHLLKLLLEKR